MSRPEPQVLHVEFDAATVTVDAVQRAAYTIAGEASADVAASDGKIVCTLYPRTTATADDLAHRLRNAAIDEVLRARIAAETAPIRNLIFAVAFASTGLTDNETHGQ